MHPFVFYTTTTYIGKQKWWEVICFRFFVSKKSDPLITKRCLTNCILVIFKMEVIFSGVETCRHINSSWWPNSGGNEPSFSSTALLDKFNTTSYGASPIGIDTVKQVLNMVSLVYLMITELFPLVTKKEEVTHACGSKTYSTPKRLDRAVKYNINYLVMAMENPPF